MKHYKLLFFIIYGIFLVLLQGCKKGEVVSAGQGDNIPAVANLPNSFSFAIYSYKYSATHNFILDLNSDTVVVNVAIGNFNTGTMKLIITSARDSILFQKEFNGGIAFTETHYLKNRTPKVTLLFTNYTAAYSCSISGKY